MRESNPRPLITKQVRRHYANRPGAQGGSRTLTPVKALVSETSMSASSITRACSSRCKQASVTEQHLSIRECECDGSLHTLLRTSRSPLGSAPLKRLGSPKRPRSRPWYPVHDRSPSRRSGNSRHNLRMERPWPRPLALAWRVVTGTERTACVRTLDVLLHFDLLDSCTA